MADDMKHDSNLSENYVVVTKLRYLEQWRVSWNIYHNNILQSWYKYINNGFTHMQKHKLAKTGHGLTDNI